MGIFPTGQRDPHLSIHAVKIFVRDHDESLRFYVDRLGFEVAFDAKLQSGDRWVAISAPDGNAVLTLVAPQPKSKEYDLIGRSTGVVLVTEDVTTKYAEWSRKGVQFHYAPRLRRVSYHHPPDSNGTEAPVWGGVFTRFRDMDGNIFEFVGFDEFSREIEAQRRASAERLEKERRSAQELEIARQVQARLFPQTLPVIGTLEYAGVCIQARQVGGDYYDFIELGRDRFGLILGDIAGKGIAAALLMSNLQANLRIQCAIGLDHHTQHVLESVNRVFYDNTAESAYSTLFFAEYDNKARWLRYVNCGHLPAILLRSDNTVERLDSTSTVLGLFRAWDCTIAERGLFPGDTLLLYTDGITESFNEEEEDFGEQRLIEALQRNRELSAKALINSVVSEVERFSCREQHDDITMIVAKCN